MTAGRPSILIVEDDPLIALDIDITVREAGYQPLAVAALEQAFELLRQRQVVGAILDFNLRNGRSDALARCLTRINIPFIVVSGAARSDIERTGIAGQRIFAKPINYTKAIAILRDRFGMRPPQYA